MYFRHYKYLEFSYIFILKFILTFLIVEKNKYLLKIILTFKIGWNMRGLASPSLVRGQYCPLDILIFK